jgi:hypothetical protein
LPKGDLRLAQAERCLAQANLRFRPWLRHSDLPKQINFLREKKNFLREKKTFFARRKLFLCEKKTLLREKKTLLCEKKLLGAIHNSSQSGNVGR